MESSASVHLRAANSQIQVSCATLAGQPLDVSFVKRCVYRARRLLYSGGGPAIVRAALGPWRTSVPAHRRIPPEAPVRRPVRVARPQCQFARASAYGQEGLRSRPPMRSEEHTSEL